MSHKKIVSTTWNPASTVASFVVNAFAIIIAAKLLDGVVLERTHLAFIAVLVLSVASALLEPVLFLLTLPINVATLGIFTFVLNGLLLVIVSVVVPGLNFQGRFLGLMPAIYTAVIISLFRVVLRVFFFKKED